MADTAERPGRMQFEGLSLAQVNQRAAEFLPGYLGIEFLDVERGLVEARLEIRPHHLAPNGFLHAGTVVTLADSSAGFGAAAALPDGAIGFTTIDLTTSFLGTATEGTILSRAVMVHGGRTTQLWDVTVRHDGRDKPMALFRCTQLVLYPK